MVPLDFGRGRQENEMDYVTDRFTVSMTTGLEDLVTANTENHVFWSLVAVGTLLVLLLAVIGNDYKSSWV